MTDIDKSVGELPDCIKTEDPSVSYELLFELAKVSGLVGAYSTKEVNDRIVGFARVVLGNKAVQEAFVRANRDCLSRAALQPAHAPAGEPVAYRYEFNSPLGSGTVWRYSAEPWNGQHPISVQALYTAQPDQSARIAVMQRDLDVRQSQLERAIDERDELRRQLAAERGLAKSAADVSEGMYADKCDEVLTLIEYLQAIEGVAGEDAQVRELIEEALRPHRALIGRAPSTGGLSAAIAAAVADEKQNPWKAAVIDKLCINFILQKEHENDPEKALQDLVLWDIKTALDPCVSKDAQDLIAAAVEPYKADAERLDLLDGPGIEIGIDCDPEPKDGARIVIYRVTGVREDREWQEIGRGTNVRSAIDAALSKKGGE